MTAPWYADGLAFSCTRCGACCTGAPGFVWVSDAEIAGLAELRGLTPDQFQAIYTRTLSGRVTLREKPNGDCVFYEKHAGCTVYGQRPAQCRTWPFWDRTAGTPEAWERTRQVCPGSGHGELIPAEEITRRIRASGL
jgi:Fe-S-cluster containining protein